MESLEEGCTERNHLPQSTISSLIQKAMVSDLQSKISYTNFNVAFYLAEAIIDNIVEMLNDQLADLVSYIPRPPPIISNPSNLYALP